MIDSTYVAGFFDGEGTVYAAVRNKGYRNPTIIVAIANTVLEPLEGCRSRWGGSICSREKGPRCRTQYQWVLAARMAHRFLLDIQPHLIIKKDVVAAAIEYCELMKTPREERFIFGIRRPSKTPGKMTATPLANPAFQARVTAVHERIKELNARGAPMHVKRQRAIANGAASTGH